MSTAESRSIQSGPIRRALDRLDAKVNASGDLTQAAADARYVNIDGDTMTDKLKIEAPVAQLDLFRIGADGPHIGFYNQDKTTRNGFIMGSPISFIMSHIGRIELTPASEVRHEGSNPFYTFYVSGVRKGYLQALTSSMLLNCEAGSLDLRTLTYMRFLTAGVEAMRIEEAGAGPGVVLIGKTAQGYTTMGHQFHYNGMAHHISDVMHGGVSIAHNGAGDAHGSFFIAFRRTTSGSGIGSVSQNGTTGVLYNTTSDRRLKQIIGPAPDALERVNALRPYRVRWVDDPERGETDVLIADEVTELVPGAVSGEPDAVDENGNPEYQQLDYSTLVPLLTAAVQELATEVNQLRARLEQLEAA